MVHHLDAIYESGVLRPLEPLELNERQRVRLIVDDAPSAAEKREIDYHRNEEQDWIRAHAKKYPGEWIAVKGSRLIARDTDLAAVTRTVRAAGVLRPLYYHVP